MEHRQAMVEGKGRGGEKKASGLEEEWRERESWRRREKEGEERQRRRRQAVC